MNTNNKPMISVITCTYNSENFLRGALESIENQTYKNIEHIIKDIHPETHQFAVYAEHRNAVKLDTPNIYGKMKGLHPLSFAVLDSRI